MAYSTGLHRLATSASRRSMGCGFCKGFRLPILPFPNNKRLNTQKYPAFALQLLPAKNPYSTASREYGFSALFSSRSRRSHLRSRCFHHRSTRRHRIRSCAFGFGSSRINGRLRVRSRFNSRILRRRSSRRALGSYGRSRFLHRRSRLAGSRFVVAASSQQQRHQSNRQ